jgi:hypothetical protein
MVERVVKATVSSGRFWALGATLSIGCAALLFFRWQRSVLRSALDEEWWRERDRRRADYDRNRQLFV